MTKKVMGAVIVLLFVLAVAGAGCTSSTQTAQASGSSKDLMLTVTPLGEQTTIGSISKAAAGNKFALYNAVLKNKDVKNLSINPIWFDLHLSNGSSVRINGFAWAFTDGRFLVTHGTEPGDTVNGTIVFAIPQTAKPVAIEYNDGFRNVTANLYGPGFEEESTPTPPVTATVAATATPSGPQLSHAQLNAIQRDMEAKGYNITQPLKQSGGIGTGANGSTFYKGAITQNPGIQYNFIIQYNLTVEVCKDNATANAHFSSTVSNLQKLGIAGSYNSPTQWSGVTTLNDIQVSSSVTKSATGPPYTIKTIE